MIDSTSCGLQLCSHPQCWHSNRIIEQRMNEVNYQVKPGFRSPKSLPKPRKSKFPPLKHGRPATDVAEYLPSIKVVNVSSDFILTPTKLSQESTISPTNSKLSIGTFTPNNSATSSSLFHQRRRPLTMSDAAWKSRCSRINLSLGELVEKTQKKSLIWKPSKRRKMGMKPTEASSCGIVKLHDIPIEQVPEYHNRAPYSRQNIRGRKVSDAIKHTQDKSAHNKGGVPAAATVTDMFSLLSSTELQDLLHMPTDELVRMLKEGVDHKVLSVKQAKTLLHKVQEERYSRALAENPEDKIAVGRRSKNQNSTNSLSNDQHQQIFTSETKERFPARKRAAYLLKRSLPSSVYKLDAATRIMAEEMINPTNSQVQISTDSSNLLQLQPEVNKLSSPPNNINGTEMKEKLVVGVKSEDSLHVLSQFSQITLTDEDSNLAKDQYFSELDFSADEPTTEIYDRPPDETPKKQKKKKYLVADQRRTASAREVRPQDVNKSTVEKLLIRASSAALPSITDLYDGSDSPDPPPPSPDRQTTEIKPIVT